MQDAVVFDQGRFKLVRNSNLSPLLAARYIIPIPAKSVALRGAPETQARR